MLSDNRQLTARVRRMLTRRAGDRTLFDYLSRPMADAMDGKITVPRESPARSLIGGCIWLYNIYAVDTSEVQPDEFQAVLRAEMKAGESPYAFILVQFIKGDDGYFPHLNIQEITDVLAPSRQEEEQMWSHLRKLVDRRLTNMAQYAKLLADASGEITSGETSLHQRRARAEC